MSHNFVRKMCVSFIHFHCQVLDYHNIRWEIFENFEVNYYLPNNKLYSAKIFEHLLFDVNS